MKSVVLEDVYFAYDVDDVLKELSCTIDEQNGLIFLAGKNGSGKSTFLNIMCGFLKPYRGNVIRNDVKIAYLPFDNPLFEHLSVKDNLRYYYRCFHNRDFIMDEKVTQILELLQIDYLDQLFDKCSSGQKQKAALACILLSSADLIILDEPFVAIDAKTLRKILAYLQKEKEHRLFLITAHDITNLTITIDHLLYLDQGTLQINTKDETEIQSFFDQQLLEDEE